MKKPKKAELLAEIEKLQIAKGHFHKEWRDAEEVIGQLQKISLGQQEKIHQLQQNFYNLDQQSQKKIEYRDAELILLRGKITAFEDAVAGFMRGMGFDPTQKLAFNTWCCAGCGAAWNLAQGSEPGPCATCAGIRWTRLTP